ncbi:small integral membrane protein 20 isoform X2 [Cimex lectularius]|uniref:Small integral membrane protein 20 n=1 Tax=Cimex lectularius TaxID=79782 RepID=A0A8I6SR94_CIMLE|nr:small integral membrane protein 20 isoform X2 [Cimex lectularius]
MLLFVLMELISTKISKLKGWRYAAFVSGIVGAIGIALYPIVVSPMLYPEEYKRIQSVGRKDIRQEDIQPGNMKVWSDPFGRG